MKFCSDFGCCYRGGAGRSPPLSSSSRPESGGVGYRRRRVVIRSKSRSSSASWRPELPAISEDGSDRAAEKKGGKREGSGWRKRSATESSRGSMGRSHHSFSHGDESIYRHSSISMAVPAFSPTPFMF